jgi:PAS domain-containing protein
MTNQENDKLDANELRQKAEAELKIRKSTKPFSEVDNLKLIHELQVHQIELEMQNEELVKAREQSDASMEKYTDLYDFAPSGFLSLSKEGDIVDLNFEAARLLGKDRIQLKKTRLGLYIHRESLVIFNQTLKNVFITGTTETCELYLSTTRAPVTYIHVEAIISESNNLCLLSMHDISERKILEEVLLRTSNELKELNKHFLDGELRIVTLKKEINDLLVKSSCEKEYLI